jgi:hypothetical protein
MIIHIGFVVDKVTLGKIISKHFGFIMPVIPLMVHAHVIRIWFSRSIRGHSTKGHGLTSTSTVNRRQMHVDKIEFLTTCFNILKNLQPRNVL